MPRSQHFANISHHALLSQSLRRLLKPVQKSPKKLMKSFALPRQNPSIRLVSGIRSFPKPQTTRFGSFLGGLHNGDSVEHRRGSRRIPVIYRATPEPSSDDVA